MNGSPKSSPESRDLRCSTSYVWRIAASNEQPSDSSHNSGQILASHSNASRKDHWAAAIENPRTFPLTRPSGAPAPVTRRRARFSPLFWRILVPIARKLLVAALGRRWALHVGLCHVVPSLDTRL